MWHLEATCSITVAGNRRIDGLVAHEVKHECALNRHARQLCFTWDLVLNHVHIYHVTQTCPSWISSSISSMSISGSLQSMNVGQRGPKTSTKYMPAESFKASKSQCLFKKVLNMIYVTVHKDIPDSALVTQNARMAQNCHMSIQHHVVIYNKLPVYIPAQSLPGWFQ